MISKAEIEARDRLAGNGRTPVNNNAGIRVGSDLHLCEMLLAELDDARKLLSQAVDHMANDERRNENLNERIRTFIT